MIYPFNTMPRMRGQMMFFGCEANVKEYLIPQVLGFRNTLDEGLKDRVQEIYLIRSRTIKTFVSYGAVTVYFRVEADSAYLAELTADIKEQFDGFMSKLGLTARTVVYTSDWLTAPASLTFAEAIRDNGLLVWSQSNDDFMSAKACLDALYPQNVDYEHSREKGNYEKEALYDFILNFHKLDWIRKNEAIAERPVNYRDDVEAFPYATIAAHIKVWISEYCLYTPAWLKEKKGFDPFVPFPTNDEFDRDTL